MFGIRKLLGLVKEDNTRGLCHNCFKSNVKLSNGYNILCEDCYPKGD
jgi:NMD protein affecting ribosome stability and mRNA decay